MTPTPITAADLTLAGIALFGSDRWKYQLAGALHVAPDTVARWVREGQAPASYRPALVALLRDRREALAAIMGKVEGGEG